VKQARKKNFPVFVMSTFVAQGVIVGRWASLTIWAAARHIAESLGPMTPRMPLSSANFCITTADSASLKPLSRNEAASLYFLPPTEMPPAALISSTASLIPSSAEEPIMGKSPVSS